RATGRISIVGTTFHAPATHSSRITWERPTAPNQQLSKKSLTTARACRVLRERRRRTTSSPFALASPALHALLHGDGDRRGP
ncbi:MAG: hypothetical protein WAT39_18540, partial [Planctomycetota bacterium]